MRKQGFGLIETLIASAIFSSVLIAQLEIREQVTTRSWQLRARSEVLRLSHSISALAHARQAQWWKNRPWHWHYQSQHASGHLVDGKIIMQLVRGAQVNGIKLNQLQIDLRADHQGSLVWQIRWSAKPMTSIFSRTAASTYHYRRQLQLML